MSRTRKVPPSPKHVDPAKAEKRRAKGTVRKIARKAKADLASDKR